jgi:hypothetical protein
MKHIAAVVIALTISGSTVAQAGSLTDPVLERDIIIEQAQAASSSSGTTIVALFSLLIFAAAVAK